MLQKIRKMMKNDKGFTLVELMVVVAILAILAAIAIPRFVGQRDEALKAQAKADIKILQDAYDLYTFQEGAVPGDSYEDIIDKLTDANYLKAAPDAPSEYSYVFADGEFYSPQL